MAGMTWQMEAVPLAKLAGDGSESTASGPASEAPLLPPSPSIPDLPDTSAHATEDVVTLSDLPSIGSLGHFAGQCSRCCFHPKGRCQNGYDCRFCHFDHEKRQRKKKTVTMSGTVRCWGFNSSSNPRAPPMAPLMVPPMAPQMAVAAPLGPPMAPPGLDHIAHVVQSEQSVSAMPGGYCSQYPPHSVETIPVSPQIATPSLQLEAPLTFPAINSWSIDRVSEWLGSLELGHLAEAFKAHRITGDVLVDLSPDDLAEIGVNALGDRKRLLRAVVQLRSPQGCPQPCPDLILQQPCSLPFMQQCGQQSCSQQPPLLQQCSQPSFPPACPPLCPPEFPQHTSPPPPPQAPVLTPGLASGPTPQWL